ncbi:MAG: triose-phosphate isomerase [Vulcanibacillus sp.]
MRLPIIAGNWKMYKTMKETEEFIKAFDGSCFENLEVVLCVPYTNIIVLKENKNSRVKIGSQNVHWEDKGAFTGEVSPLMLKELEVQYAIIGHSERRHIFAETDETVNMRVHASLKHGIMPIICVGEKLKEREENKTQEVVKNQTEKAIEDLTPEQVKKVVIAYEPIWAIGTGKSSSAEDANNVIGFIRKTIANKYNQQVADEVRIQYGGSVNSENIKEFMKEAEIDGALVGGASLESESFKLLLKRAGGQDV